MLCALILAPSLAAAPEEAHIGLYLTGVHGLERGDEAAALRFDRRTLPLFVVAYLIIIGAMILDAPLYH